MKKQKITLFVKIRPAIWLRQQKELIYIHTLPKTITLLRTVE